MPTVLFGVILDITVQLFADGALLATDELIAEIVGTAAATADAIVAEDGAATVLAIVAALGAATAAAIVAADGAATAAAIAAALGAGKLDALTGIILLIPSIHKMH